MITHELRRVGSIWMLASRRWIKCLCHIDRFTPGRPNCAGALDDKAEPLVKRHGIWSDIRDQLRATGIPRKPLNQPQERSPMPTSLNIWADRNATERRHASLNV